MERTKPPLMPRRVSSDDLSVIYNGEVYYPHAGEWVEFRGRPTVGLYLRLMELGRSSAEGIELLTAQMHAWNWTDDDGKSYANPPTVEVVMGLPMEELAWLLQKAATQTPSEVEIKNGSTPSTVL